MKNDVGRLIKIVGRFALAGAIVTLLYTIAWMIWYENTTGYSAGNAPLFWIFIGGPAGAAVGAFIGLMIWLFKKPDNGKDDQA